MAIKPFHELTLADDFMFGEVMRRPENAKPFLEALLGKKIGSITAIDKQKELTDGAALHGVRLDVCLEDESRTQYDVEMQTGASYGLEKRIRYYQSSIDRRTLKSAESYRELRQSFVIFICTDDYYKRGLAVYRRRSVIEGAEDIAYDDGSHAYILNASFTEGNSSAEVLDFLRYIDAGYRGRPLDVRSGYVAQIEQAVEALGPIALLVNNAGIAQNDLFQDTPEELWRRMFAVHADGAFHTIQAILPRMLHEKEGCIVNVSSIWGLRGAACETAYAASKAALIGLTRSLAAELAPSHIRVNCVAPGVIRTDMVEALGEETIASLAEQTPAGRLGTPEDVAKAVAFLVGPEADFITGQVLTVDGGFIL